MDNNYFDFLGQNSVASNDDSNTGSSNDKGKVNLTVRVDADCQVVCDGDFLFLANANQIVKDKAPMGQHIFNFTSLDFPEATVEKIVDFPVEGNNYLIVVNELNEKIEVFQKEKEAAEFKKRQAEEENRIEYEKTHDIVFSVESVQFKMIYVKGGTYDFGKEYKHKVTVNDFHIGEYVVTQGLWIAVMGSEPTNHGGWRSEPGRNDDYPATKVSWYDCQEFINKINKLTGRKFRLPTEAEWEFAARGGVNRSDDYFFSGSNDCRRVAWNRNNSGGKLHEVGALVANELGIYDMSGNVFEHCSDYWCNDYDKYNLLKKEAAVTGTSAVNNPHTQDNIYGMNAHVIRGGSYSSYDTDCNLGEREMGGSRGDEFTGFRLVLDV